MMEIGDYLAELKKVKVLEISEEKALWVEYKEAGSNVARQKLIESYQPLVFKAAASFRFTDKPMDIIQEGTVGLIEAVEIYDYKRGVAFSLYALHRIRGRMITFLQKEGIQNLTYIDKELYNRESSFCTIDDAIDQSAGVAEQFENKFLVGAVKEAMQRLPEKEKQVLNGVFFKEQAPSEMAEKLAITPSHVYRLQKQGIRRIRGMLSKLMQHW